MACQENLGPTSGPMSLSWLHMSLIPIMMKPSVEFLNCPQQICQRRNTIATSLLTETSLRREGETERWEKRGKLLNKAHLSRSTK